MKIYSVTPDNKFKEFVETGFQVEHREELLETWLENNPDAIVEDEKLLIIGRQVTTNFGGAIDLLAVDRDGNLVVIELKRDRTPRETVAQALEYASFGAQLSYEQLERVFSVYVDEEAANLAQYHREYYDLAADEALVFNKDQRIVIVGQTITPEIRQTASFLGSKGLRVTCLEFTLFKADDGLRLLSTGVVVLGETESTRTVASAQLPRVSQSQFLAGLDPNGRAVLGRVLEWAKHGAYTIHWGAKGFSLNVVIAGIHAPLAYAYPPHAVYGQSLYTALWGRGGLLSKIDAPEEELQSLMAEAQGAGLYQPAGREFKCAIARPFSEQEINWLLSWFDRLAQAIRQWGLRGQA